MDHAKPSEPFGAHYERSLVFLAVPFKTTRYPSPNMAFSARLARAALRSSAISRRSFAHASKLTDDDFSPEQLKYNFFNMPLLQSKIDIATKHGAYDHATYRAAFTDAVEEKIEKYEPEIKPDANQVSYCFATIKMQFFFATNQFHISP
jgi:hypothetical protein